VREKETDMLGKSLNRLIISVVILFDFLLLFWAARQYRATAEVTPLVMAIGSVAVTVVLLVYLVRFNRNHALFRHMLTAHGRDGNDRAEANG